jgi:hypothetical protein
MGSRVDALTISVMIFAVGTVVTGALQFVLV